MEKKTLIMIELSEDDVEIKSSSKDHKGTLEALLVAQEVVADKIRDDRLDKEWSHVTRYAMPELSDHEVKEILDKDVVTNDVLLHKAAKTFSEDAIVVAAGINKDNSGLHVMASVSDKDEVKRFLEMAAEVVSEASPKDAGRLDS